MRAEWAYAITISLVGILGNQPRVSSVSCQSYNKRSNWLACLCLVFYVRNEDYQPSSLFYIQTYNLLENYFCAAHFPVGDYLVFLK